MNYNIWNWHPIVKCVDLALTKNTFPHYILVWLLWSLIIIWYLIFYSYFWYEGPWFSYRFAVATITLAWVQLSKFHMYSSSHLASLQKLMDVSVSLHTVYLQRSLHSLEVLPNLAPQMCNRAKLNLLKKDFITRRQPSSLSTSSFFLIHHCWREVKHCLI